MTIRLAKYCLPYDSTARYALVEDGGRLCEIENFFYPGVSLGNTASLSQVKLLPPVPGVPSKIIAVGLNYPAHVDEMKHQDVPEDPVLFLKAPSAIVPTGHPICFSEEWGRVDYEGELAVVIGKQCKDVPENQALEYILGYTLANDVTARDYQKREKQWGRAKNFDTFCPLGPYLLLNTGQDPDQFEIQTQLDGQVVQEGRLSQVRFSIPFLVSYISAVMTLYPGDIILTGTPQGVGPLAHGQTVRVGSPNIGWLESPVVVSSPSSILQGV